MELINRLKRYYPNCHSAYIKYVADGGYQNAEDFIAEFGIHLHTYPHESGLWMGYVRHKRFTIYQPNTLTAINKKIIRNGLRIVERILTL